MAPTTPVPVRSRWQASEVAERYAAAGASDPRARFRSPRRARRDAQLIERGLRRFARPGDERSVLDAPCGTGRLFPPLAAWGERYLGLDVSPAMAGEARRSAAQAEPGAHLIGDLAALPFRDRAFSTVVACRVLHHIVDDAELARMVAELVRVSSGLVIASFWDAASWRALRLSRSAKIRRDARVARPRGQLDAAFTAAGARVLGTPCSAPFIAQQTFLFARVAPPLTGPLKREPA